MAGPENSQGTLRYVDADQVKINGKVIWFARELER
jgi:hypothetical protein